MIGAQDAQVGELVGAVDYLLKQRLQRLGPAVRRAGDETEHRRQHREAEEALRQQKAEASRNADRVRELESELGRMADFLSGTPAAPPAQQILSLAASAPERFHALVEKYGLLLDRALEERSFKVDQRLSEALGLLAQELGVRLNLSPRHGMVSNRMRRDRSCDPAQRSQEARPHVAVRMVAMIAA